MAPPFAQKQPSRFAQMSRNISQIRNPVSSISRDLDIARARKEFFPNRPDVSDERAFDMAKKMKPTGRINADDIKRVAKMLASGKKPVLDSKGKPVKNLFQKRKARDLPLKTVKGMRKPFAGKALKRAAKKMKKMI